MTGATAAPVQRDRMVTALEFIKAEEAFRSHAYMCPNKRCTIGWGHTGKDVHLGLVISRATGERLLERDMLAAANAVSKAVRVPLGEDGYAALISFAFNVGIGAFEESTLLFQLSQKRYDAAAEQFARWVHDSDGDVIKGLVTRRAKEKELFLRGVPK